VSNWLAAAAAVAGGAHACVAALSITVPVHVLPAAGASKSNGPPTSSSNAGCSSSIHNTQFADSSASFVQAGSLLPCCEQYTVMIPVCSVGSTAANGLWLLCASSCAAAA
jgi:hypothetical protein